MTDFNLRNYEAVAFDFDGLLAKSNGVHTEARVAAFTQTAVDSGDQRYAEVDPAIHREAYLCGGTTPAEIIGWVMVQAELVKDIDDPAVAAMVERKNDMYHQMIAAGLEEQPGAAQLVRSAMVHRPGKLAIASTARRVEVMPFLDRYKLNRCFPDSRLILAEHPEVTEKKPKPDAYLAARRALGVTKPERLLAIEDSPEGIEAAKLAGVVVLAVAATRSVEDLQALRGFQRPDGIAESLTHARQLLMQPPA